MLIFSEYKWINSQLPLWFVKTFPGTSVSVMRHCSSSPDTFHRKSLIILPFYCLLVLVLVFWLTRRKELALCFWLFSSLTSQMESFIIYSFSYIAVWSTLLSQILLFSPSVVLCCNVVLFFQHESLSHAHSARELPLRTEILQNTGERPLKDATHHTGLPSRQLWLLNYILSGLIQLQVVI